MMNCNCGMCGLVNDCIAGGLPERCYVNGLLEIQIRMESKIDKLEDKISKAKGCLEPTARLILRLADGEEEA